MWHRASLGSHQHHPAPEAKASAIVCRTGSGHNLGPAVCLGSQGPSFWVSRSILLGKVSARRLQGWAVDLDSFQGLGKPQPVCGFC